MRNAKGSADLGREVDAAHEGRRRTEGLGGLAVVELAQAGEQRQDRAARPGSWAAGGGGTAAGGGSGGRLGRGSRSASSSADRSRIGHVSATGPPRQRRALVRALLLWFYEPITGGGSELSARATTPSVAELFLLLGLRSGGAARAGGGSRPRGRSRGRRVPRRRWRPRPAACGSPRPAGPSSPPGRRRVHRALELHRRGAPGPLGRARRGRAPRDHARPARPPAAWTRTGQAPRRGGRAARGARPAARRTAAATRSARSAEGSISAAGAQRLDHLAPAPPQLAAVGARGEVRLERRAPAGSSSVPSRWSESSSSARAQLQGRRSCLPRLARGAAEQALGQLQPAAVDAALHRAQRDAQDARRSPRRAGPGGRTG